MKNSFTLVHSRVISSSKFVFSVAKGWFWIIQFEWCRKAGLCWKWKRKFLRQSWISFKKVDLPNIFCLISFTAWCIHLKLPQIRIQMRFSFAKETDFTSWVNQPPIRIRATRLINTSKWSVSFVHGQGSLQFRSTVCLLNNVDFCSNWTKMIKI